MSDLSEKIKQIHPFVKVVFPYEGMYYRVEVEAYSRYAQIRINGEFVTICCADWVNVNPPYPLCAKVVPSEEYQNYLAGERVALERKQATEKRRKQRRREIEEEEYERNRPETATEYYRRTGRTFTRPRYQDNPCRHIPEGFRPFGYEGP